MEVISSDQRFSWVEQGVSRGLGLLFFRQVITYGAIFVGNILLSRWISIENHGHFTAELAFQQTLAIFSHVRIRPTSIQGNKITIKDDLASFFTLQMIIFGMQTALGWIILDLIIIHNFYPWWSDLSFKFRSALSYIRFGINNQSVPMMT